MSVLADARAAGAPRRRRSTWMGSSSAGAWWMLESWWSSLVVVVRWLVPWWWSQAARLFPCSTRRATRVEQRAERGEVLVVDGGEFEFLNFCKFMIDFFSVENDLGEVV